MKWVSCLSLILLILVSGCLSGPWITPVEPSITQTPATPETISSATLGPLPKELFVEMVFYGITEDAKIKVWLKGEKQRTNIVRIDKEGEKIIEATTIFEKPYMYLKDQKDCVKMNWPEDDELSGSLEFFNTIYNPYIRDKYAATAYWDAKCSEDPNCKNISVAEDIYQGKDVYLLTVAGREAGEGNTVIFWVNKSTSYPIKKLSIDPGGGNTSTEYIKIKSEKLPDELFVIPEGCLDLTIQTVISERKVGNISQQFTLTELITVILEGKPIDVNLLSIRESNWFFSKAPWVVQRTTLEIKSSIGLPEITLIYDASGFEKARIPDLTWAYYNETNQAFEPVPGQVSDATEKTIRSSITRFGTYVILDKKIFQEQWGKDVTEVNKILELYG